MKKIFFLVNRLSDLNFSDSIEKYIVDCAVFVGTHLPPSTDEYELIILWNYRKRLQDAEGKNNIVLFHSAPLPEGRGWAPIYNSIAKGLSHYTVSGIFAADEVDSGDIIVQARFPIKDNYTAADLRRWDTEISLMLTGIMLKRMENGPLRGKKQVGQPSVWSRRGKEDNRIDIQLRFADLISHLRACEESHPSYFMVGNERYFVRVTPERPPEYPEDVEITFFDSAQ